MLKYANFDRLNHNFESTFKTTRIDILHMFKLPFGHADSIAEQQLS